MVATTGTPRARALAAEMREARLSREIGLRELARRIGISHTLVSQWENGHRLPKPEDVAAILTGIGVDAAERARIVELAHRAGDKDWIVAGIPGAGQQLTGMLECERTAVRITEWIPWSIPGLLQTSDYARVIIGSDAAKLNLRLARRDILTRRNPVEFRAIIGEPGLRQVIGDTDIMVHQLHTLLNTPGNVSVQAVPIGRGWHPGVPGTFILYEFDHAPAIVHLEPFRSSSFVYNENDVADYKNAVTTLLTEVAMSPEESMGFITEISKELEKTQ